MNKEFINNKFMNKLLKNRYVYIVVSLLGFWSCKSISEEAEFLLSSNFLSQYISEGRDNLSHGGAVFYTAEVNKDLWQVAAIHGQATSNDYEETNISISYSVELHNLSIVPSYTWLSDSSSKDQEVGVSFAYNNDSSFSHQLDWYYSKNAGGSFYTWQSGKKFKVFSEVSSKVLSELRSEITLEPYLHIGANRGYVSDEHSGVNYYGFGINSNVQVTPSFELTISLNRSKPINKKNNETLDDLSWLSIGIDYQFS